jgi:hypothetical protein
VRDSFFAGRQFASLQAMHQAAEAWCLKVAGRRACRPLGGAQPMVVFQAIERPALLPLPPTRFELAAWSRPKVHADCHIQVAGALSSVPWRLVGRHVDARATTRLLEVFVEGELVKTHLRAAKGRKRTDWSDYPPEKVAFLERTPAWCRRQAAELGSSVARLVAELLAGNALHHLRAAQGSCGSATATGQLGWRRPALGRWPSVTEATGPSRASWPPGPTPPRLPPSPPPPRRSRRCCMARPRWSATLPPRRLPPTTTTPRGRADDPSSPTGTHPAHPQAVRHARHPRAAPGPGPRRRARPHLEFLQVLGEGEIARRQAKALRERVRRARFEEPTTLEDFDFSFNPKLPWPRSGTLRPASSSRPASR